MKIVKVELRELNGTLKTEKPFWEERLVRPIDIYPEYRSDTFNEAKWGTVEKENDYPISAVFVEIIADDCLKGIGGPIDHSQAHIIKEQLSHLLIDKDPLAIERLWDQMHRFQVHGRQGTPMIALSAVDCALWDLKGKYYNEPVYKIIGGPTRDKIPAYSSMLGFAVEDMGLVKERAIEFK